MSGNFRCDACKGMFMSLAPVGHDWLCGGCVSKAAGERASRTEMRGGATGITAFPCPASARTSDSPVAAEALEPELTHIKPHTGERCEYGRENAGRWSGALRCNHCGFAYDSPAPAAMVQPAPVAAPVVEAHGAAGGGDDMSNEAVLNRWAEYIGPLGAFVRSEVERARPPKLTDKELVELFYSVRQAKAGLSGPLWIVECMRAYQRRLRGGE